MVITFTPQPTAPPRFIQNIAQVQANQTGKPVTVGGTTFNPIGLSGLRQNGNRTVGSNFTQTPSAPQPTGPQTSTQQITPPPEAPIVQPTPNAPRGLEQFATTDTRIIENQVKQISNQGLRNQAQKAVTEAKQLESAQIILKAQIIALQARGELAGGVSQAAQKYSVTTQGENFVVTDTQTGSQFVVPQASPQQVIDTSTRLNQQSQILNNQIQQVNKAVDEEQSRQRKEQLTKVFSAGQAGATISRNTLTGDITITGPAQVSDQSVITDFSQVRQQPSRVIPGPQDVFVPGSEAPRSYVQEQELRKFLGFESYSQPKQFAKEQEQRIILASQQRLGRESFLSKDITELYLVPANKAFYGTYESTKQFLEPGVQFIGENPFIQKAFPGSEISSRIGQEAVSGFLGFSSGVGAVGEAGSLEVLGAAGVPEAPARIIAGAFGFVAQTTYPYGKVAQATYEALLSPSERIALKQAVVKPTSDLTYEPFIRSEYNTETGQLTSTVFYEPRGGVEVFQHQGSLLDLGTPVKELPLKKVAEYSTKQVGEFALEAQTRAASLETEQKFLVSQAQDFSNNLQYANLDEFVSQEQKAGQILQRQQFLGKVVPEQGFPVQSSQVGYPLQAKNFVVYEQLSPTQTYSVIGTVPTGSAYENPFVSYPQFQFGLKTPIGLAEYSFGKQTLSVIGQPDLSANLTYESKGFLETNERFFTTTPIELSGKVSTPVVEADLPMKVNIEGIKVGPETSGSILKNERFFKEATTFQVTTPLEKPVFVYGHHAGENVSKIVNQLQEQGQTVFKIPQEFQRVSGGGDVVARIQYNEFLSEFFPDRTVFDIHTSEGFASTQASFFKFEKNVVGVEFPPQGVTPSVKEQLNYIISKQTVFLQSAPFTSTEGAIFPKGVNAPVTVAKQLESYPVANLEKLVGPQVAPQALGQVGGIKAQITSVAETIALSVPKTSEVSLVGLAGGIGSNLSPKTIQVPKPIQVERTKELVKMIPNTTINFQTRSTEVPKLSTLDLTEPKLRNNLESFDKSSPTSKPESSVTPVEVIKEKPVQILQLRTVTPVSRIPFVPPVVFEPGGGVPNLPKKPVKKFFPVVLTAPGIQKAYDVFVGRGKKKKRVASELPFGVALGFGQQLVENTALASFQLKERGLTNLPDTQAFLSSKFRPAKKGFGFVELSRFRINTPTEKAQIPGKAAALRRAGLLFRPGSKSKNKPKKGKQKVFSRRKNIWVI